MPLTKDFKETVGARLRRSAGFRKEVLREAVECLLAGELETGKALLRDYVNGTIGFEKLAELTGTPSKSLMRMLGPSGNPQARNLFDVLREVQHVDGTHLYVVLRKEKAPAARQTSPLSRARDRRRQSTTGTTSHARAVGP